MSCKDTGDKAGYYNPIGYDPRDIEININSGFSCSHGMNRALVIRKADKNCAYDSSTVANAYDCWVYEGMSFETTHNGKNYTLEVTLNTLYIEEFIPNESYYCYSYQRYQRGRIMDGTNTIDMDSGISKASATPSSTHDKERRDWTKWYGVYVDMDAGVIGTMVDLETNSNHTVSFKDKNIGGVSIEELFLNCYWKINGITCRAQKQTDYSVKTPHISGFAFGSSNSHGSFNNVIAGSDLQIACVLQSDYLDIKYDKGDCIEAIQAYCVGLPPPGKSKPPPMATDIMRTCACVGSPIYVAGAVDSAGKPVNPFCIDVECSKYADSAECYLPDVYLEPSYKCPDVTYCDAISKMTANEIAVLDNSICVACGYGASCKVPSSNEGRSSKWLIIGFVLIILVLVVVVLILSSKKNRPQVIYERPYYL